MKPNRLINWMKKALQALMCGMILLNSSMPIGAQVAIVDPENEQETIHSDPASSAMEARLGYSFAGDLADGKTVPVVDNLTAEAVNQPHFTLEAEPQILFADTPVTLSWEVKNPGQYKELTTEIILPKGLSIKTGTLLDTYAGKEEKDEQNRYQVDQGNSKGSLELLVEDLSLAPFVVEVQLKEGDNLLYGETLYLDEAHYTMSASKSEQIVAENGKVTIESSAKGMGMDLAIDVRNPSPNHAPGFSLSGNPFEIIAVDSTTKQNATKFAEAYTLTVTYDEERLMGMAESDLSLYYYDPEIKDWWPIETIVDPKTNQLTAQVDHLTVFDYQANTWQSATLPSVDSFQVNQFTGSGTYNLSLWTPPGPGGFQPTLNLSYNSQIIDDATAFVQASWVGMGWSLDTGYIQRDMHGTNEDLTDDTFLLNVGGVSSRLLPISTSGTVTSYATTDRSYMTIEYDSSTEAWTVWDNAGMKYVFGHTTATHTTDSCVNGTETLNLVWRWSLTAATNIFEQTITYAYANESKGGTNSCLNQVAVYPATITYPNSQYRVQFTRESRTDYQTT